MDAKERRRFVDSDVFLYALQAHPRYGETAKNILKRIDTKETALTSLINVEEVCRWLERHQKGNLVGDKIELIDALLHLQFEPLTLQDVLKAAELGETYQIDFNDRVSLAVMERNDIKEIYSNDTDFDNVEGVTRIFE